MKVITHTCPTCGTIVAGNVLQSNRLMKCPRVDCEQTLGFEDLDEDERRYLEDRLQSTV